MRYFRRRGDDHFNGSISDVRRIGSDIGSALRYIHERDIIHNDFNTANVLYSRASGAVLIDFGLSFYDGHPTRNGGSPGYLPPEFVSDWRSRGPPSDMWGFGVLLAWLLGCIPLPERAANWWIADIHPSSAKPSDAIKRMMEWLERIENARARLQQGGALHDIVRDALEPEMKKRIDAATLEQRLRKIRL